VVVPLLEVVPGSFAWKYNRDAAVPRRNQGLGAAFDGALELAQDRRDCCNPARGADVWAWGMVSYRSRHRWNHWCEQAEVSGRISELVTNLNRHNPWGNAGV
jgi:hypothetical protein